MRHDGHWVPTQHSSADTLNTESATSVDLKNKDGGIRPETLITYVRLHIQSLHSGFESVGKIDAWVPYLPNQKMRVQLYTKLHRKV